MQGLFLYDVVGSCLAGSIPVLQNRFLYYRVGSGIAASIPVLQNRLRCYRVHPGTTESFRYDRIDSGTTWPIPALQSTYRHYRVDSCTTGSTLVLQGRPRYYRVDSCIAESVPVLQGRHRCYRADSGIAESTPVRHRAIPVMQSRPGYYRVDSCNTETMPVPRSRSRYYRVDPGTTGLQHQQQPHLLVASVHQSDPPRRVTFVWGTSTWSSGACHCCHHGHQLAGCTPLVSMPRGSHEADRVWPATGKPQAGVCDCGAGPLVYKRWHTRGIARPRRVTQKRVTCVSLLPRAQQLAVCTPLVSMPRGSQEADRVWPATGKPQAGVCDCGVWDYSCTRDGTRGGIARPRRVAPKRVTFVSLLSTE